MVSGPIGDGYGPSKLCWGECLSNSGSALVTALLAKPSHCRRLVYVYGVFDEGEQTLPFVSYHLERELTTNRAIEEKLRIPSNPSTIF
jgi:hypothetical protein